MAGESIQKKLGRVRAPRVHITYDVEIGNAIQLKEIPFVVGVLSDLSGTPEDPLPPLKERDFVEIDRDNFNTILEKTAPRLTYGVPNKLGGNEDKQDLKVELKFQSLKDFEPEQVAQKIEPIRKLVEARKKLSDLLSKMDGNDRLVELMQDVIKNTDALQKLKSEAAPVASSGEQTPPENKEK